MTRFLALVALMLALVACDADGPLVVLEPDSGATVSTPFTVRVKTAEPLGHTESGRHHIRIWFDGDETRSQDFYESTAQITDLPRGSHTMTVSLRNADHSDVGPRVNIPISVGEPAPPSY